MTAEVAVMNKSAVALAADSAVTIEQQNGRKIYNTVNKLFMLSKYQPVGIMMYGSAELMGVPWESIIKIYRERLHKKSFDTLEEYAVDFVSFLDAPNPLFPAAVQTQLFDARVGSYFTVLRSEIDTQVKAILDSGIALSNQQLRSIVRKVIRKHYDLWHKADYLSNLGLEYCDGVIGQHEQRIDGSIDNVFGKLPILSDSLGQLRRIAGYLFCKDRFSNQSSGIVVAGFGEADIFPSLHGFQVEAIMNDRLKYVALSKAAINFDSSVYVQAFAQKEMVHLFMEGVDPFYDSALDSYLSRLFGELPDDILASIPQLTDGQRKDLSKKLNEVGKTLLENFKKEMQSYRRMKHIDPVIATVAVLPKDELAAVAESLVNLTSFKRRYTMVPETVGGPIDVAVISKGDGFVWIKRKHYFDKELNPYFFANYYKDLEDEKHEE